MFDRERILSLLPFRNRKSDGAPPLPSLDPAKLFEKYKQICYVLGKHLDKNPNEDIARMIYQADLEMTPGLFLSLLLVTAALCAAIMFVVSLIVFLVPFSPFASESPLLYIFILTFFAPVVVAAGFPFYLTSQISNKKIDIEKNLPYALAFMSILASSGATPLDIIRRIAREDYGHISSEFRKVVFRVEILGEDAVTAMNSMVNSTPSEVFRDICMDLTNLIYGGSGLAGYLASKSKELMEIRRQTDKEFVESLSVFGEGYLGGIVMTLTLAVLGIVISSALGVELGPFTPDQLFFFLVYLGMPLINVLFLLMLGVKYSTNP
ncbi:type II secretion system F family protein [Methanoculleus sp.]|uniref:type II secretion system F family protein n=1 Tax=Methanoculleus sp. TaxID=90427 RepID=UPI001BD45ADB|nr:type II secretion system F family protein [Methanoculleus sp.]